MEYPSLINCILSILPFAAVVLVSMVLVIFLKKYEKRLTIQDSELTDRLDELEKENINLRHQLRIGRDRIRGLECENKRLMQL